MSVQIYFLGIHIKTYTGKSKRVPVYGKPRNHKSWGKMVLIAVTNTKAPNLVLSAIKNK